MTRRRRRDARIALTLIELLVVIAITAILLGMLLSAAQRVRSTMDRTHCANKVRQLALALLQYEIDQGRLPPGQRSTSNPDNMPYSGWTLSILPYLEQQALYKQSQTAYQVSSSPFKNPPHVGLSKPFPSFVCPSDPRGPGPQVSLLSHELVAFTGYLGVSGLDYSTRDGVLYQDSQVRLAEITDGTSNTLLLGERPPSANLQFGWWYAGVGQAGTGSADLVLGVREKNLQPITVGSPCGPGSYSFAPGQVSDPCSMFHFWSPHFSGANFALADGSVHFIGYSSSLVMPALASRAGGEVASIID